MDESLDNKVELRDRLIDFFKRNKFKIYFLFSILLILVFSIFFIDRYYEKQNNLIAEKYIEAGINLSSNNKENAKKIYEEIILSKNKFYSILSLNTILEKNLETDKSKILKLFKRLEALNYSQEQLSLISLKKALYLKKNSDTQMSQKLLKELIEKNSKFKNLAKELLVD